MTESAVQSSEVEQLALEKLGRVLGTARARQLYDRLVAQHRLEMREMSDLFKLADALGAMGGIEAAVGAMLGVAAVLRGARQPHR